MKGLLTFDNLNKFLKRNDKRKVLIKIIKYSLSLPYKFLLASILQIGLKLNYFDYPPHKWPPNTPARKYIEEFLTIYKNEVKGRCVEFAPPYYKKIFANNPNITSYEVWNITPNIGVTIVGDLQDASHIPDSTFDTIICTHVLCNIERPWLAVKEIHRLLSPGGIVLCTNPVVAPGYSPHPKDYWRFTTNSMEMLFSDFKKVKIHQFGNAVTMAATSFFLMSNHLPKDILKMYNERFPIIVAIAAWK